MPRVLAAQCRPPPLHAVSAGQRRSLDVASRTSSAASVRGMGPAGAAATTADTASSPERRQPRGQGDDAAAAAAGSQGQAAANSEAAAAAEQLQAVALDDDDDTPGSPAAAAASAAASEAEAEAPSKEPEQQPAAQQQQPVIEQPAQPPSAQQPAQPPPAGAQPPGASLFSVPMASAPTTGIYSIPQARQGCWFCWHAACLPLVAPPWPLVACRRSRRSNPCSHVTRPSMMLSRSSGDVPHQRPRCRQGVLARPGACLGHPSSNNLF